MPPAASAGGAADGTDAAASEAESDIVRRPSSPPHQANNPFTFGRAKLLPSRLLRFAPDDGSSGASPSHLAKYFDSCQASNPSPRSRSIAWENAPTVRSKSSELCAEEVDPLQPIQSTPPKSNAQRTACDSVESNLRSSRR